MTTDLLEKRHLLSDQSYKGLIDKLQEYSRGIRIVNECPPKSPIEASMEYRIRLQNAGSF